MGNVRFRGRWTPRTSTTLAGGPWNSEANDAGGVGEQFVIPTERHKVTGDRTSLAAFHDYSYRRDLEAKKPSISSALSSAQPKAEAKELVPQVPAACLVGARPDGRYVAGGC